VTGVVTVDTSFADLVSPGDDTHAVLTTAGAAALPTATVSVMVDVDPTAIGPGLVHVTTWPFATQCQPAPLAEMKVKPAGSVSVTEAPAFTGEAMFCTARV
jgi:hypothetical protein